MKLLHKALPLKIGYQFKLVQLLAALLRIGYSRIHGRAGIFSGDSWNIKLSPGTYNAFSPSKIYIFPFGSQHYIGLSFAHEVETGRVTILEICLIQSDHHVIGPVDAYLLSAKPKTPRKRKVPLTADDVLAEVASWAGQDLRPVQ